MWLHWVLFSIFGLIAVGGAVNLLVQRHPINSALSLIAVMGALAVEYLLLGAEFIAAIQIIVYAGAIMVLFVFVIMLLNAGEEEKTAGSRVALLLGVPGLVAGAVLVAGFLLRSDAAATEAPVGALYGSPHAIGRLLFGDFMLAFEITAVLILIAIMGAVVLASRSGSTWSGTTDVRREP
jgi:NADH-quinone oxidoreductase subunit J